MPDITYSRIATVRRAASDAVPSKGDGPNMKIVSSYQNPGPLVVGSTIKFMRIDSSTRIHRVNSALSNSANAASTTLAIGLASVNNNIAANVPAALLAATSIAAAGLVPLPNAIANAGLRAWELAGLTADPGGQFDVYGTTGGATLNASSDILVELGLSID